MSDDTTLSTAVGTGDKIRTVDRGTKKTPVSLLDVGGTSAEALIGDSGVALPIKGTGTAGAAATGVVTIQGIASAVAVKVDGSAVTQPVSATSLPLPSGAATAAAQATGITALAGLDTKLTILAGYLDGVETALAALALESGGNLAAAAGGIGAANDAIATQAGTGSVSAKLRLVTSQLNTLAGYLDGVEGLLGSVALETGGNLAAAAGGIGTASDAVAVQGSTGSVSAKLRLVTSQLNTLLGYTDGLETLLSGLALETGGNLAAAAASLSVIDDWDESDRGKVNPIVGQAGVAAGAGAVSATVQRTTLASDDPAVASLSVMDDWDESDRAKVNLIAGQAGVAGGSGTVSALTQRMCLATDVALPAGANLLGDINARRETGTIYEATVALTVKRAKISAASSGENTIVAAVTNKKIRVLSLALIGVGTAVSIYFKDAASGNGVFADSTNPIPIDKSGAAGAGGLVLGHNLDGWFQTAESGALILNLSGALAVAGCLSYAEVE